MSDKDKSRLARAIAPEDVRIGDYITVTSRTYELVPFDCEDAWKTHIQPVRIDLMDGEAGCPLRVVERCLPFVLVRCADGEHRTLDLRRTRIARLGRRYGSMAFAQLGGGKKSRKAGRGI